MKKTYLTAGLMGLFLYLPAHADLKFSGYLEGELRLYPSDGLLQEQREALASVAAEPELSWKSESEEHSLRFKTFARYSDPDGQRDHIDIRELYYNYAGSGWQFEAGINKVYWGVAESLHLVDIVNQTDFVESVNGEQKLGQPMVSFGLEQDWGNLDLYVLPYFRERKYPDGPERFRLNLNAQAINFDKNSPLYDSHEDEKHVDFAVRWANSFDAVDVGISYFTGTNREPIPILVDVIVIDPLIPVIDTAMSSYYEQLEQVGIELQYLYDDWAFKFESVGKRLDTGNYNSAVMGFEYTLSDVASSGGDLGLLVEYLWNDRDNVDIYPMSIEALPVDDLMLLGLLSPAQLAELQQSAVISGDYLSPFEEDIFIGTRFSLNDISSTEFLAGIIVDVDDQSTSASFEGSTRLGDSIRISLNIYLFENIDKNSAFYSLRKDDQIETRVAWYF